MTDATAIPINLFENDRELIVVAPMPGVEPEDISIDVTDAGEMTLRAAERGPGQDRIEHLLREWSYGPYERTITLPRSVDARRANLSFDNGVLTLALPKVLDPVPAELRLADMGGGRGLSRGHVGSRGGASAD